MKCKKSTGIVCFILIFWLLACSVASSETKQLVCKQKLTQEIIDNRERLHSEGKEEIRVCKESGRSYANKAIFLFEKSSLNNPSGGSAEGYFNACWEESISIFIFKIETTPSFIILHPEDIRDFTINRETLKGGFGIHRNYDCTVSDYINKKNKI